MQNIRACRNVSPTVRDIESPRSKRCDGKSVYLGQVATLTHCSEVEAGQRTVSTTYVYNAGSFFS